MRKKMLLIFFISGACGLIYQVLWVRMLGLIFGNTTYAVSTILAGFMAGLALGSWWFGKYIDRSTGAQEHRSTSPMKVYAFLMLGIGVYCAFTPLLFGIVQKIYVLFGSEQITSGSTFLVFAMSFTVILIPTFLMGGTLPVLTKWVSAENAEESQSTRKGIGYSVGILYSVNTWGAVIGAFLTGYVLIMILGVRGTLYLASAVNVVIAGIVFMLSKNVAADFSLRNNEERNPKVAATTDNSYLSEQSGGQGLPITGNLILIAIAISGFTALTYEVVWTRVLSMILGSSVYAFATMLCAFLAGIALGSMIYAKILARRKSHPERSEGSHRFFAGAQNDRMQMASFGFIQAGIGISVLLLIPIFAILPMGYLKIFMAFGSSFAGFQFMQFLLVFGIMLIPTTLFGITIPLACRIYSGGKSPFNPPLSKGEIGGLSIGSSVGNVYAANTIGAVLGSILAGFILIPLIGLQKTITLIAMINVILAVILLNSGLKERKWQRGLIISFLLFFTIPYALAVPDWNKKVIGSGIYSYAAEYRDEISVDPDKKGKIFKLIAERRDILYYKEATHFTVSVVKNRFSEVRSLKIDGKADASNDIRADMSTQILSAHLPMILHSAPENVLVVGLASGVTLGSVTRWKNLKEIDCVDIEPAMIEASRFFDEWNNRPLEDKRVEIIINDARNYLLTTKKKYDIIISEPSNPWMSGCAPLFTQNYFKQVQASLTSGGLFCMWLQGYRLRPEDYRMILGTLKTVFSDISIWEGSVSDTLLIAGNEKLSIDMEQLKSRISHPAVKEDLSRCHMEKPFNFLAGFIAGEKGVMRMCENNSRINSDGYPHLEFSAGKTMYDRGTLDRVAKMLSDNMESVSPYIGNFKNRYELAAAYLEKKNYLLAEEELKKSIEESTVMKESYNLLGYTYLVQNRFEPAERMFDRAIDIDPAFIRPYVNLSMVSLRRGNTGKALKILKTVIKVRPDYYIAYNNLGDIYLKQSKYDEAVRQFNKCIEVNPRFELPYISMAAVYSDVKGLHGKAEKYLLKAIEINPLSASAYYQLGRVYMGLKKPEKAAGAFDNAMKIKPGYVNLVRNQLSALNSLGKERNP